MSCATMEANSLCLSPSSFSGSRFPPLLDPAILTAAFLPPFFVSFKYLYQSGCKLVEAKDDQSHPMPCAIFHIRFPYLRSSSSQAFLAETQNMSVSAICLSVELVIHAFTVESTFFHRRYCVSFVGSSKVPSMKPIFSLASREFLMAKLHELLETENCKPPSEAKMLVQAESVLVVLLREGDGDKSGGTGIEGLEDQRDWEELADLASADDCDFFNWIDLPSMDAKDIAIGWLRVKISTLNGTVRRLKMVNRALVSSLILFAAVCFLLFLVMNHKIV
ncbi:uncharacterized protein G2W53_039550 [Senna tora]|uniref:Uncharacterized protein n=1 Tax=Senna tora TaxID=362788 RepID=A0A834T1G5_9FABA|nr:uncharacterized protein G2W53_039550 [Senna tora]